MVLQKRINNVQAIILLRLLGYSKNFIHAYFQSATDHFGCMFT